MSNSCVNIWKYSHFLSVPPKVTFIIDDFEDEWVYEGRQFDFIHARYLAGSVRNFPRLLEQCYK